MITYMDRHEKNPLEENPKDSEELLGVIRWKFSMNVHLERRCIHQLAEKDSNNVLKNV